jgi:hypothetical protein
LPDELTRANPPGARSLETEDISLLAMSAVDADMLSTPHLSRVENMTPRLGERLLKMADEMIRNGTIIREHLISFLIWCGKKPARKTSSRAPSSEIEGLNGNPNQHKGDSDDPR